MRRSTCCGSGVTFFFGVIVGYLLLQFVQPSPSIFRSRVIRADSVSARKVVDSVDSSALLYNFSSFECAAGSQIFDSAFGGIQNFQTFEWLKATKRASGSFPEANDPAFRTCMFRNVCMVDGKLTYYMDPSIEGIAPDIMRITAFEKVGGMFYTSMINKLLDSLPGYEKSLFMPEVIVGARPSDLLFAPTAVLYVLDQFSDPSNWAHLLLDTIVPTFAVAELFGRRPEDIQLLGLTNCSTWKVAASGPHDFLVFAQATKEELCLRNTERWLPAFFDRPYLFPPHAYSNACFHELVAGQAGSQSIAGLGLHKRVTLRAMREHLYRRVGVDITLTPARHRVLVLLKKVEQAASLISDLCAVIRGWLDKLGPAAATLDLECIVPANMSVREQVENVAQATVLIFEQGSTGHLSSFLRRGASVISIYTDSGYGVKEAHTLFTNTDIQAWYIDEQRMNTNGESLLQLALHKASIHFHLPINLNGTT